MKGIWIMCILKCTLGEYGLIWKVKRKLIIILWINLIKMEEFTLMLVYEKLCIKLHHHLFLASCKSQEDYLYKYKTFKNKTIHTSICYLK